MNSKCNGLLQYQTGGYSMQAELLMLGVTKYFY